MSAILIVGEDEELHRRILPQDRRSSAARHRSGFGRTETISWAGFSGQIRERAREGVTVLNLTDPAALSLREATRLPDLYPGLRALYVLDTAQALSGVTRRRLTRPGVDILNRHANRAEFEYRITRLLEMPSATLAPASQTFGDITQAASFRGLMPELHDPKTGRLDARRLAEWFGLPLTVLARALGREYATVHRTPAGLALQKGLRVYLRIASALDRVVGSAAAARVWLNAPNPDLADETPRTLMERSADDAEVVAGLLEDSLLGMPG